jgi:hypothetical protein
MLPVTVYSVPETNFAEFIFPPLFELVVVQGEQPSGTGVMEQLEVHCN